MFDETPKVDFTVNDADGNVIYRDSIVYSSMAELRADSATERQVKFQQRYDNWLATQNVQPEPTPEEI